MIADPVFTDPMVADPMIAGSMIADPTLAEPPVMPDLSGGAYGFWHTIDSALHVLDRLRISESRITIQMAGPGRRPLQIVRQEPKPQVPLTPSTAITLWVSGFGMFHALPLPMRESGGEAEIGTREIVQIFDDPIQKAAHWFRAGAPLFEIGPEKYAACRRWLAIFGIDHEEWPEALLYPLSLVAPVLARLGGREAGIRFAFSTVLRLPVHRIRLVPSHRLMERQDVSLLGREHSRVGRDFIMGDRQEDCDRMAIQFGPVSLETYRYFHTPDGTRLMHMMAAYCVGVHQTYSLEWQVGDIERPPRLGSPGENGILGVNFHLGRKAVA
ncbi:MAG TPA: type VI secretion system baseplate subunit TssG [Candidatus Angelobacter sp.]|nr:type VI secretion system baseplate subunit TssG [Candidatus Angelobacter sp.]